MPAELLHPDQVGRVELVGLSQRRIAGCLGHQVTLPDVSETHIGGGVGVQRHAADGQAAVVDDRHDLGEALGKTVPCLGGAPVQVEVDVISHESNLTQPSPGCTTRHDTNPSWRWIWRLTGEANRFPGRTRRERFSRKACTILRKPEY